MRKSQALTIDVSVEIISTFITTEFIDNTFEINGKLTFYHTVSFKANVRDLLFNIMIMMPITINWIFYTHFTSSLRRSRLNTNSLLLESR